LLLNSKPCNVVHLGGNCPPICALITTLKRAHLRRLVRSHRDLNHQQSHRLQRMGGVAVRAMVPRKETNRVMDELWAIGARGILATDIHACRL
jgi:ATP phosphoribosyltransferase-like protein